MTDNIKHRIITKVEYIETDKDTYDVLKEVVTFPLSAPFTGLKNNLGDYVVRDVIRESLTGHRMYVAERPDRSGQPEIKHILTISWTEEVGEALGLVFKDWKESSEALSRQSHTIDGLTSANTSLRVNHQNLQDKLDKINGRNFWQRLKDIFKSQL